MILSIRKKIQEKEFIVFQERYFLLRQICAKWRYFLEISKIIFFILNKIIHFFNKLIIFIICI